MTENLFTGLKIQSCIQIQLSYLLKYSVGNLNYLPVMVLAVLLLGSKQGSARCYCLYFSHFCFQIQGWTGYFLYSWRCSLHQGSATSSGMGLACVESLNSSFKSKWRACFKTSPAVYHFTSSHFYP